MSPSIGWRIEVERLDYTFAIAGAPRLVSGAEAVDPTVPCLLISQSLALFKAVTFAVAGRVVASRALRGFQQTAVVTRRGSVSCRERLLLRAIARAVEVRCSTD